MPSWRDSGGAHSTVVPTDAVVMDEQGEEALRIDASLIREHGLDEASQDAVWQVDISAITTRGTYRIVANGVKTR